MLSFSSDSAVVSAAVWAAHVMGETLCMQGVVILLKFLFNGMEECTAECSAWLQLN